MNARRRIFVGGPIKAGFRAHGVFDSGLRHEVERVNHLLQELGFEPRSAHRAENYEALAPTERVSVAGRDLGWLDRCDVHVAICPLDESGALVPSFGTAVEVGWSLAAGRPLILLVDKPRVDRYSPFLTSLPADFNVRIVDLSSADLRRSLSDAIGELLPR